MVLDLKEGSPVGSWRGGNKGKGPEVGARDGMVEDMGKNRVM